MKHLFDLLDGKALVGRPVLLSATARAKQHALMIEHQWRPLFGFFNALTLPFGIFATEEDFVTPIELTDDTKRRVAAAVDQLERVIGR